jgi:signal transduction histidine kinase/CheY-like chemotaxis protein/L-asparagine transporter-like permease
MQRTARTKHVSLLAAWALAFGCAVGWDSFVWPWTTFLPKAGPLGTIVGLVIGGLVMTVIAWNYHCMINRHPGPGGIYSYATEAFGIDHGFICSWFLCLTYMAIVWSDATALNILADYALGDFLHFGFRYTVVGFEVYLGNVLLSLAAIAVAAAICCRRRLSCRAQTVLALFFAVGVVICFAAAASSHTGGFRTMAPTFHPDASGSKPFMQILGIVTLSPWLFVGFEAISNLSGEFNFPLRKSFGVMAAALAASVVAYVFLALLPVLAPDSAYANWVDFISGMGASDRSALDAASRHLGKAGMAVISATLVGALFTNLVGNTIAASRLMAAMADDGVLPAWLRKRNRDGVPRNAVLTLAMVSLIIVWLGRTVIGIVVEIALVSAGVSYAYTSAATLKFARKTGDRLGKVTGFFGLVLSVLVSLIFILLTFMAENSMVAGASCLIIIVWCIVGLVSFLSIFRGDRHRRFGHSTVVWISLLAMILIMLVMWIRQTTYNTTANAFDDLIRHHAEACTSAPDDELGHDDEMKEMLLAKKTFLNHSILLNSYAQIGLIVLAFGLMFSLYAILRRREREIEEEKSRAKNYFFSTVSHDIRTPLNAIIGFSEMLKEGFQAEEERKRALDAIILSGKTLLGLVNDILDLSKLESGKMEIVPEPLDCPRLLQELMDAFRVSSGKPKVEMRCNVAPMPLLLLDPQRIRQIVFNLVGNAVKFTDKGHVELRASFDQPVESDSGVFRIDVEDTGCGISDKDKARIGSAYVQVGAKLARNGGTGLGLAICSQLAAAMGGKLDFDSVLGRGSRFSIIIPGVKTAAAPAATRDTFSVAKPNTGNAEANRRLKHILIVDDMGVNLMVLKAHLKNVGDFNVAMASDGVQALEILNAPGTEPFDLVLTDMWMPNMDGDKLVKAIRANPSLSSLRVIAVTADVALRGKFAKMGFDGILLKPITHDNLRAILYEGG